MCMIGVGFLLPVAFCSARSFHLHLGKGLSIARHDLKQSIAPKRREATLTADELYAVHNQFAGYQSATVYALAG